VHGVSKSLPSSYFGLTRITTSLACPIEVVHLHRRMLSPALGNASPVSWHFRLRIFRPHRTVALVDCTSPW